MTSAEIVQITEEDVLCEVLRAGFPETTVFEPKEYWDFRRSDRDDYWCLAQWEKNEWHVFYSERGGQDGLRVFPDKVSAESWLVAQLFGSAVHVVKQNERPREPDGGA